MKIRNAVIPLFLAASLFSGCVDDGPGYGPGPGYYGPNDGYYYGYRSYPDYQRRSMSNTEAFVAGAVLGGIVGAVETDRHYKRHDYKYKTKVVVKEKVFVVPKKKNKKVYVY